jgi:5'-3' exonuclease
MGIPSYFRSILQKYPGCLQKLVTASDILCFDFNCLIYRCIRSPGMPPYPASAVSDPYEHDTWEGELLKEVVRVVREVWVNAGKPKSVLLAVDGVVPMAKIRQQRVRRFKSAWLRTSSSASSASSASSWDTNAITPGTKFMEKLGTVLKGVVLGAECIVSGVDEEGEGEHKIMRWLRLGFGGYKGKNVVVYGLDADLILLTMLVGEECDLNMHLMREKQEFGGGSRSASGSSAVAVQDYQFLDIREFQRRVGPQGREEVLNYIALMSLMGNDFLPHSLTHKLGDGGHDCVITEFSLLRKNGWLVDASGNYKISVLGGIFRRWASDEDGRMLHMIMKKEEQARRGVGKGMDASEGLPLEWAVEKALLSSVNNALDESWRDVYWENIHPYANDEARDNLCAEYLRGFQWILDYYQGRPVNMSWMFPAWIPPLWSDLFRFCERRGDFLPVIEIAETRPLPQEQLAMVLPLESWGLVRDAKLRRLPVQMPQMWPRKFGFFSLGRKWLWECEARIPVITAGRLREEIGDAK